ncbi:hypothetical protein EU91_1241 [Prochlorococcus marinus str. GP2]|uniref:Uncharacterized protein n=1 Tax=Prochlorococcus marinus str. GP2 TaxID=59925 RepID=A0A0A1ZE80_PROMR|nr:hypothetical protein EU91_1241 [Prochlorococcus marinus str. GP2]
MAQSGKLEILDSNDAFSLNENVINPKPTKKTKGKLIE